MRTVAPGLITTLLVTAAWLIAALWTRLITTTRLVTATRRIAPALLTRLITSLAIVVIARTIAALLRTGLITSTLALVVLARTLAALRTRLITTLAIIIIITRTIAALLRTGMIAPAGTLRSRVLETGPKAFRTETAIFVVDRIATVRAICTLSVDTGTLWPWRAAILFLITFCRWLIAFTAVVILFYRRLLCLVFQIFHFFFLL